MSLPLPFDHSTGQARGAAAGVAIPLGGIRSTDLVLAVIKHDASNAVCAGVPVSDYVVGDGTLTAATDDSSGCGLVVVWRRQ